MRWKQNKTNKRVKSSPFVVLPRIEVVCEDKMPKNPGLRLFTKTWQQPQREPENGRPLTATLEKPQVLDINLVTKIDMSLIRKEFLCITNLCRVPLDALSVSKARRKSQPTFAQNKRCNTPLSLPNKVQLKKSNRPCTSEDSWEDDQSSSSQTYSSRSSKKSSKMNKIKSPLNIANAMKQSKAAQNDANNNTSHDNFKTYRVPKNRNLRVSVIDKTDITKLPQPCKTCGRVDQPERFHSHPDVPSKPSRKLDDKIPAMKNTVQKPVAIRYKSKLTEKKKTVESPAKKRTEVTQSKSADLKKTNAENVDNGRAVSVKGPRTVTCYICGREFGTMSLPLHEPKCLEKWERENAGLPPNLRRKRPVKPDGVLTKDEWNAYAWESSQANLVPCENCGRTFYPDRLVVHQRSCKPKETTNMAKQSNEDNLDASPVPAAKPRSIPCKVCGRLFGTKSIKIHEPQCLKKWHLQNDHLPPNEREPVFQDIVEENPPKPKQLTATDSPQPEKSSSASKKPPMFLCYLCGRLFSVNSIYIHEPQCLKKWKIENDKLPPHKRRPEPLKPDIKFTPDGKLDQQATGEANWVSHLQQLVPCRMCGRTFNPDRVDVHERSCKGRGRRMNDIKVEILQ